MNVAGGSFQYSSYAINFEVGNDLRILFVALRVSTLQWSQGATRYERLLTLPSGSIGTERRERSGKLDFFTLCRYSNFLIGEEIRKGRLIYIGIETKQVHFYRKPCGVLVVQQCTNIHRAPHGVGILCYRKPTTKPSGIRPWESSHNERLLYRLSYPGLDM